MQRIERTTQFKRDYKRELNGRYRTTLGSDFIAVLNALFKNKTLNKKYQDHALVGDWADHRDCHIRPNLVLIYRRRNNDTLQLVRLGSHSQLGL